MCRLLPWHQEMFRLEDQDEDQEEETSIPKEPLLALIMQAWCV